MTESGEDETSWREKWRAMSFAKQVFATLAAVVGVAGTLVGVGWTAHSTLSEQAEVPGRLSTVEDSVLKTDLNERVRELENRVANVRAIQKERAEDLREIRGSLESLVDLADRILCKVENPQASCINPDGGSPSPGGSEP